MSTVPTPARTHVAVPGFAVGRKAMIAVTAGIAGGIGMSLPIVIYDGTESTHSALELPMAAAAWLFGLDHFVQNGYRWGPIAIGAVALVALWMIQGAIFGGVADRFLRISRLPDALAVGVAWGFVSWVFFWYTLLPIAHAGAPFMATAVSVGVAPVWVFVLAFACLGLATGYAYWATHPR